MFTITIRLISTCLPVTINSDTTTVTITDNEGRVHDCMVAFISKIMQYLVIHLVFRVQFASTTFSGLESSGEILVSVIITGVIPIRDISVNISFAEATATG